jgi:hypothetical protein
MKKIFLFTLLTLYLMGKNSLILAMPCWDKIPALPFIGHFVYTDCDQDQILYFVPEALNLKADLFSGQNSFIFREKKDGTATVKLSVKLLTKTSTVLRVIRALKRDHKKQYRIKPFRIKDIQLTGFSADDGIILQKITAKAPFSDSTFTIQLKLNRKGVESWKASATDDFWKIEPAKLSYKLQARNEGRVAWREMGYSINIESLPACAILGEECTEDINRRLAAHGRLFGQLYFHSQYVQCRDFLDSTFEKPSRAEIGDEHLDFDERETVYLFAKEAFIQEYEAQKQVCANKLDCLRAKKWLNDFADEEDSCALTWQNLQGYLGYRSPRYLDCARAEYKRILSQRCQNNRRWDCDQRKGDAQCAGTLKGSDQVCFAPQIIKDNVPFQSGTCDFAVFLKNPDFLVYVLDHFVETSISQARRVPTCVNISQSVNQISAVRTRVQCQQH